MFLCILTYLYCCLVVICISNTFVEPKLFFCNCFNCNFNIIFNFLFQKVKYDNSTSKLHYIKPRIEEWESAYKSCRKYEVQLSRIRIGHTRLTHGHLMSRNDQPPTCIIRKPNTNNKTLPTRLPPME